MGEPGEPQIGVKPENNVENDKSEKESLADLGESIFAVLKTSLSEYADNRDGLEIRLETVKNEKQKFSGKIAQWSESFIKKLQDMKIKEGNELPDLIKALEIAHSEAQERQDREEARRVLGVTEGVVFVAYDKINLVDDPVAKVNLEEDAEKAHFVLNHMRETDSGKP